MKKWGLIIALGLGLISAPAFAYDNGHNNSQYGYVSRRGGLDDRIRQVDRQLDRVRWQLRRSNAGWRIRREVGDLSRRLERVKWQYRTGSANRHRLYRELEQIDRELDRIQDRLRGHRGWD